MEINAKVISNDDEITPSFRGLYGARFYSDTDPENENNKVIKIFTLNTTHNISSTTNIAGFAAQDSPTSCVFEMKYRFEGLWYYSKRYFKIEFCNNAGTSLFALQFNVKEGEDNLEAKQLSVTLSDNTDFEEATLQADRWYTIRAEYYHDFEGIDSRLKFFICCEGEDDYLFRDVKINAKSELPTRALIIHYATKIKGIQYLDDMSFTLFRENYTEKNEPLKIPENSRKIYDFESGIPSEKDFFIDMRLKKFDDFLSMDPALWGKAKLGEHQSTQLLHTHEHYEIMLVQTGNAVFVTESESHPIYEGSIIVIPPQVMHNVISDEKYNIISITGDFEQFSRFDSPVILQDNVYSEGKKLAELVLYNRFTSEEYFTALCNAYIHFLFLNLDYPKSDMNTVIYKIMDEMKKNYGNSELSIIQLLRDSGYAKDYVRTKFFEVTKMTPKKYLTAIRMKRAKELLGIYGEDVNISRIAEQCGIVDPAVFSKNFKQFYGISPKQYIKKRKG